jgi:hypothetical protein
MKTIPRMRGLRKYIPVSNRKKYYFHRVRCQKQKFLKNSMCIHEDCMNYKNIVEEQRREFNKYSDKIQKMNNRIRTALSQDEFEKREENVKNLKEKQRKEFNLKHVILQEMDKEFKKISKKREKEFNDDTIWNSKVLEGIKQWY